MEYLMNIILWIILLQAFFCACFCSFIAQEKKRDKVAWFLNGLFFSLIALIAISGVPALLPTDEPRQNILSKLID
jgi:cytochrome bd-type quinol oxidase subunit 2